MLVLAQRLMRVRSAQARAERIASRVTDGWVSHSGSYSMQNSTQPIGALVVSPVAMNKGRSAALPPASAARSATATMPALTTCSTIIFVRGPMRPLPVRGHVSQKAFAAALSSLDQFEAKDR